MNRFDSTECFFYLNFLRKTSKLPGHSLGAQTLGAAGREFKKKTGYPLGRITGLDPANPCFYHKDIVDDRLKSLSKFDARLIDVIHTNGGYLGVQRKIGHMDFYPNGGSEQAGCDSNIKCSHERAPVYFDRTVVDINKNKYKACNYEVDDKKEPRPCNDATNPSDVTMGYHIKYSDRPGKFYLKTEKEYGKVGALTTDKKALTFCQRVKRVAWKI